MYFLSKNMCFLRIVSKISAKPKKSGPADEFSGVFTPCDRPAGSTRDPASPCPAVSRSSDAPSRRIVMFRGSVPAPLPLKKSTTKFDFFLVLIKSYSVRFDDSFIYQFQIRPDRGRFVFCFKLKPCKGIKATQKRMKRSFDIVFFEKQTSIFHVLFLLYFLVIIIFIIGLICLIRLMCR